MSDRHSLMSPGRLAGVVGLTVALCAATPAFAQMVCGQHKSIHKRLQDGYQESPVATGLATNGSVVTLYTSDKGTFTVLLTRPNGMACLMAVGESFEFIKKPARSASLTGSSPRFAR